MTAWTFADGSVLRSRGRVTGKGKAAVELRKRIDEGRGVQLFLHPSAPTPLDVDNDYLLDGLAADVAAAVRVPFDSEYERVDEDAPAHLRARRSRFRAVPATSSPYGTVH
jgi:hypothetical protein